MEIPGICPNTIVTRRMREIVCEHRDGMGTTGWTVGRETVGKGRTAGHTVGTGTRRFTTGW